MASGGMKLRVHIQTDQRWGSKQDQAIASRLASLEMHFLPLGHIPQRFHNFPKLHPDLRNKGPNAGACGRISHSAHSNSEAPDGRSALRN